MEGRVTLLLAVGGEIPLEKQLLQLLDRQLMQVRVFRLHTVGLGFRV